MIKQKSLVGTELDSSIRTIEASQLTRLNRAFSQPNVYAFNKPSEQKVEFTHLPPFLFGSLSNLPHIYKMLELNINNLLLSRESVISHVPIKAGDALTVRTFLKDAYEQQASANPIGFIILESVGLLGADLAFYVERVIAVRGGFQRERGRAS